MNSLKLKDAFDVESIHGAFYTGGNVEWHGEELFCQTTSQINVFNIETGVVTRTVGEENQDDGDYIHTFTTDGLKVITSHKSGLLKQWNDLGQLEKSWKYIHNGPIAKLVLWSPNLASGGSDGVIRIWNLEHQACLQSLKGCQGVISTLELDLTKNFIYASGDDGRILSYSLKTGQVALEYKAHFSKVTAISFHADEEHFVSAGRDKVVILWKINEAAPIRTIPVYEVLESVIALPKKISTPTGKVRDSIFAATAGDLGKIRIWDCVKGTTVYTQDNSIIKKASEDGQAITRCLFNEKSRTFAVISYEQNILLYKAKSFVCTKQFIGFQDEILDIVFIGENDSHIAVATNSNDIKLYEVNTMSCQLLQGHTDLVLSLNVAKSNVNLMISASKDNTIRLWLLNLDYTVSCVGMGRRHTGSISSVAFANLSTKFCVSVSQDTCVKVWEVPATFDDKSTVHSLMCNHTEIAHQKDINCVVVSPNDKIIATSSQDKTVKLWTESLELIGILKGHKRGVWCVRFSPVDQVVLTSSADCTIKLFSITDLSCLKTFEGHEASVLRVEFLSKGMQFLSVGGDGLIKLFNVKSSECSLTLDKHESRIWALSLKSDESGFITGGSDSFLIKWKDITEDIRLEKVKQIEEATLDDQKLRNYLASGDLLKALRLSLKLGKPLQTLRIIEGIIKKDETGLLVKTIRGLRDDQKDSLMKCATTWNMNSKNCHAAQLVINALLWEVQDGGYKPAGLPGVLEGAIPYTERHFKRLTQLMQDLHFITYTVNCMQPHAKVEK